MSNQFIDCYNFIRHMVQNDKLRQISLKLQLLDAALYSDEPRQAIGNIISQSQQLLSQDDISQFYKLSERDLDHRLFNQIKLELFTEAQKELYPYYNQYLGSETIFNKLPAGRLRAIVEDDYQ